MNLFYRLRTKYIFPLAITFDLPSYLNFAAFNKNKIYTSLDMMFDNYPVINSFTISAILELKRKEK